MVVGCQYCKTLFPIKEGIEPDTSGNFTVECPGCGSYLNKNIYQEFEKNVFEEQITPMRIVTDNPTIEEVVKKINEVIDYLNR